MPYIKIRTQKTTSRRSRDDWERLLDAVVITFGVDALARRRHITNSSAATELMAGEQ